jgi:soluble lytic murein transglycosylase
MRGADRLGERAVNVVAAATPQTVGLPADMQQALQRIDLLDQLGLDEAAGYEIARLRRSSAGHTDWQYALGEALNARGHTDEGIAIGREILNGAHNVWNARLLRIVYPLPFRDIIMAQAGEQHLDPFLVAGLIRQESMFDPDAFSRAGAVGLMQVMPGTGRDLARTVGVTRFDTAMLENPEVNATLGTIFLSDLMKQNKGRVAPVLAAYNAGPARLARWIKFPEYADDEAFAERIPFDETRDYVRVVQLNAHMYAALYGPPSERPASGH